MLLERKVYIRQAPENTDCEDKIVTLVTLIGVISLTSCRVWLLPMTRPLHKCFLLATKSIIDSLDE